MRLDWGPGYPAGRTPLDLPFSRRLLAVVGEGLPEPVIALPTLGGSIPMYLFSQTFGVPVVGLPIVNHDNTQHAADENLRLAEPVGRDRHLRGRDRRPGRKLVAA